MGERASKGASGASRLPGITRVCLGFYLGRGMSQVRSCAWRRLLFWTWTTNPCPHDVLHSTDPSPVRCKTLVFRDSDSVWSIRRRASMCRYASLVLQTPLRFRAAATASTHQLCSGLLTGVSAATCTRHDVAATASCNAAARRPGARPRRLARRSGWREAGQSGGAGRRRAHGESK